MPKFSGRGDQWELFEIKFEAYLGYDGFKTIDANGVEKIEDGIVHGKDEEWKKHHVIHASYRSLFAVMGLPTWHLVLDAIRLEKVLYRTMFGASNKTCISPSPAGSLQVMDYVKFEAPRLVATSP